MYIWVWFWDLIRVSPWASSPPCLPPPAYRSHIQHVVYPALCSTAPLLLIAKCAAAVALAAQLAALLADDSLRGHHLRIADRMRAACSTAGTRQAASSCDNV